MSVTIRDVARRAGVSISTVSRVLNDTCPVQEDKRRRVREAVKILGYAPNPVARSLLRKETGGLGVLLPYVSGEFFSELLYGIDRTTRQLGFFLMISTSHGSPEELRAALRGMRRRVDGLLIMAPEGEGAVLGDLLPDETPVVLINTPATGTAYDALSFDNYRGGFLATAHLLEQGHRRIAMLKGPAWAHDARERLRGYREALVASGLAPSPEYELAGDYSPEAGHAAAEQVLALQPRPTAVFAANDQSALAMIAALRNAGVAVPGDLSLVGFDDIPSARFASPSLTTVRVPIRELGVAAVQRLVVLLRGHSGPVQQDTLPVELVVRGSTARGSASARSGIERSGATSS